MSTNVIREDVVKVGFDADLKVLQSIVSDLNKVKKAVGLVGEEDGLDKVKEQAEEATKSSKKLNDNLKEVGNTLGSVAKKAAKVTFKGIVAGVGASATAIAALTKQSVSAYGDFEQLKGGVETLFGAKGAKSVEEYAKSVNKSVEEVKGDYKKLKDAESAVIKNANNAYKTAGLSANDYMTTVTSFSASLIQSLKGDTTKAVELADKALVDMSDNANKMGTDMGSIQYAYQGFAKQNYTMLDNLKLGYGGTKSEMERLLKDAQKLSGVKYDISSYADVVEAIHVIQENMGITGTTAKEANQTIQGSFNSMKAAWGNLLPAFIQGGDQLDQCINNFVESVGIFGDNVLPAVEKALGGIGVLVEKLAPMIEKELPILTEKLLPPLLTAATSLLSGLIKALPSIVMAIVKEIPYIATSVGKAIIDAFGAPSFGDGVSAKVGKAIAAVIGGGLLAGFVAIKGKKIFDTVSSFFSSVGGTSEGVSKASNPLATLAKTNTKVVLKGMANLAIIIGGLTVIAAALALVAPHIAKLTDTKSMLKLVAAIAILGVVGSAMSVLAGYVGKIPVATVAKGLANIAIIIGGMSALFLLIGAVSLVKFDLDRLTHIVKIIGILGGVGSALALFAGIVGLIPIPVVLAGLANIALVIAGMTAIITAFGLLSKIKGFNEFITNGGDVLSTLFNQIGKIAGSLIGGLGEGVSESLPKIGDNLASFAKSIKPMFTAFEGADVKSIGSFFKSMGSFMLQMAANDAISIFTGGTKLGELGGELTTFATNSKEFFKEVATFPKNSFANAKKLFDCLSGINGLPKEGGIKSWFTGDIAYDTIANGLHELAGEKVIGFFNSVAKINKAGFTNGKELFECLTGIKGLPKEGGIKSWFSGETDYSSMADGLKQLSDKKVIGFFNSVAKIPKAGFENAKTMFKTLADIGETLQSDGFKQLSGGTSGIGGAGDTLKNFSTDMQGFFTQVNNLKTGNLKGLSSALSSVSVSITSASGKAKSLCTSLGEIPVVAGEIASSSSLISDNFGEMVGGIKKSCDTILSTTRSLTKKMKSIFSKTDLSSCGKKMMNSLLNGIKSKTAAILSTVSSVASKVISKFNATIKAANHVLTQFGAKERLKTYQYANGTTGHKGGNAVVNDGQGAEIVQMPNGRTFVPSGRNVFIPNAPKGMKVLDAERTAQVLGRSTPTFHYKNGTGFDATACADGKEIASKMISSYVDLGDLSGLAYSIAKAGIEKIKAVIPAWADKIIEKYGGWKWPTTSRSITSYFGKRKSPGGIGSTNHMGIDIGAAQGSPVYASKGGTVSLAGWAGGYGKAVRITHSNGWSTLYAHNSKLLVSAGNKVSSGQTIAKVGSTGKSTGPHLHFGMAKSGGYVNPLNYLKHKNGVGMKEIKLPQPENDGLSKRTPSGDVTTRATNTIENNTYSPVFNLTISGTQNDKEIAAKVKKWVAESLEECFEGMARRNCRSY